MPKGVLIKSIICFLAIALIEVGCCVVTTSSCGCDGSSGATRYSVKGFDVRTYVGSSIANSLQETTSANLKIVIDPSVEYISKSTFTNGFNILYACDPAPAAPTQTLVDLAITSKQDFKLASKTIKAGESLNEIFFLDNGANGNGYLPSYLQSASVDAVEYDYVLSIGTLIVEKQAHQFDISITLSGNQKFSLSTTTVALIP